MSENSQRGHEQVSVRGASTIIVSINYETREITITSTFRTGTQTNNNFSEAPGPSAQVEVTPANNQPGPVNQASNIEEMQCASEEVLARPIASANTELRIRQTHQANPSSTMRDKSTPEVLADPSENIDGEPDTRRAVQASPALNIDEMASHCNHEDLSVQKSVIFVQNEANGAVNINIGAEGTRTLRMSRAQEPPSKQSREEEMQRKVDCSSGTYLSNGSEGRAPSEDSSNSPGELAKDSEQDGEGDTSSSEDENPTNGESEESSSEGDGSHDKSSQKDDREDCNSQEDNDTTSECSDFDHCNGHANHRIIFTGDCDTFEAEL